MPKASSRRSSLSSFVRTRALSIEGDHVAGIDVADEFKRITPSVL